MYHIATHNIGLGSYDDDFIHSKAKGHYRKMAWLPFQKDLCGKQMCQTNTARQVFKPLNIWNWKPSQNTKYNLKPQNTWIGSNIRESTKIPTETFRFFYVTPCSCVYIQHTCCCILKQVKQFLSGIFYFYQEIIHLSTFGAFYIELLLSLNCEM